MTAARSRPPTCAPGAAKPLSASISAPNKDSSDRIGDYAWCFSELAPLADYVTVNVSSPNTPGLARSPEQGRTRQIAGYHHQCRAALYDATPQAHGMRKPILLKIAPDLDLQAMDEIAEVVRAAALKG